MSSPSYFTGAHDFNVSNLTIVNTASPSDLEKAFQHLYDNIAIEAVHNSAERYGAPKCHEDTRKVVQGDIHSWMKDGDDEGDPKKILWLTGPAGAGKTAIMGSVADTCEAQGLLAGSFFFSSFAGSEERRLKRYLVPTLAYYLVIILPPAHPLRCSILTAVQRDPSIFKRRLDYQFTALLLTPYNDTKHRFDPSTLPKAFIIDGLDEVEAVNSRNPGRDPHEVRLANEEDQEDILSALLNATSDPTFPFRIVVASRLERVIQTFFSSEAAHATREIFLDDKYNPDADIALYLRANFAKIRRRYRLPPSWPSAEDIRKLVYNASGQFIYAATVVRFLQSGKRPNPQAVLNAILYRRSQGREIGALEPLDALYARILQSSPDTALAVRWIRVICLVGGRSSVQYPGHFVNLLLQDYEGQPSYLLENLTSLISIPPIEDLTSSYRFHHKSFEDFLRNKDRCGEELSAAFEDPVFFGRRCNDVFLRKSAATRIPESHRTRFLCHLIQEGPGPTFGTPTNFMDSCDVVWWVQFALHELSDQESQECILEWFRSIHVFCPSQSPGECHTQCKHWRGNILRACKGLGWGVPNVVALFREAMYRWVEEAWPLVPRGAFLEGWLHPGIEQLESNDPALRAAVTQYTVDEDYQAALDLVRDMFSHLPTDWEAQLTQETKENLYVPWNGFASVIQKIMQDVGIEEPDVAPSDRWLVDRITVAEHDWDSDVESSD
ncbi:hypothetical protein FA13DRAFT_1711180 [Coprinellus micaceus]|uniref:NACHT domain-containing protein n=1 Tax=Coprinellus micaceus TaxID=71717 RepID=A0A4Y7T4S2_COPMI|nr:hypothetical protein FA13DRAFT_1711180 [Coprinellus micaceus]